MANKTLSQLRTAVRELSNTENNTGAVPDSLITDRLNEAVKSLYDLLVDVYEAYYQTTASFALTVASPSTPLPDDFYKAAGLDRALGGGSMETVLPLGNWLERNHPGRRRYAIAGGSLTVYPPQMADGSYVLYYVPLSPQLVGVASAALSGATLAAIGPSPATSAVLTLSGGASAFAAFVGAPLTIAGGNANDGTYAISSVGTDITLTSPTPVFTTQLTMVGTASVDSQLDDMMSAFCLYLELHAAVAILDKREMDSSAVSARLAAETRRVQEAAGNRDEEPGQVPLVRRRVPGEWPL